MKSLMSNAEFDKLTQAVASVDATVLKLAVFERVYDIFRASVVTPEAAPFVVGRIYEALTPWREHTIAGARLTAELERRAHPEPEPATRDI